MKLLSSWFFFVPPFTILPRWKLAVMRQWLWRYQRYTQPGVRGCPMNGDAFGCIGFWMRKLVNFRPE
jgi:hypothetical protein